MKAKKYQPMGRPAWADKPQTIDDILIYKDGTPNGYLKTRKSLYAAMEQVIGKPSPVRQDWQNAREQEIHTKAVIKNQLREEQLQRLKEMFGGHV